MAAHCTKQPCRERKNRTPDPPIILEIHSVEIHSGPYLKDCTPPAHGRWRLPGEL